MIAWPHTPLVVRFLAFIRKLSAFELLAKRKGKGDVLRPLTLERVAWTNAEREPANLLLGASTFSESAAAHQGKAELGVALRRPRRNSVSMADEGDKLLAHKPSRPMVACSLPDILRSAADTF